MSSGIHKECGERIVWLRRPDDMDRFLPPMEYAGEGYIGVDGCGVYGTLYKAHLCDPEKVLAWIDYQKRLAVAKGEEFTPLDAARQREREDLWTLALTVACPRCDAAVNVKCHSLAQHKIKQGIKEETLNPHPERIEHALAWKDEK